jgi:formamidase
MGDIHFSQGDGEISFCGAIEMSGYIDLHVDIIKGGVEKYAMINPHVAYRRECLNATEYLKKFGYTGEQAYLLLSCAPVEGRVSGIVDIPNACCTLALPTEIFDKDILPT